MGGKMGAKTVREIEAYYNEMLELRKPSDKVIENYAQLMKDGEVFPPIVLGRCPKPDTFLGKEYDGPSDGNQALILIDGVHRFLAAKQAKVERFEVHETTYKDLPTALADMLARNKGGRQVTMGERDRRIKVLVLSGLNVREVAPMVGMHFSSVSRIARDLQEATKTGEGSRTKEKTAKKVTAVVPYKEKATFNVMVKLVATLENKRFRNATVDFFAPANKEGKVTPNKEALQVLDRLNKSMDKLNAEIKDTLS